MVAAGIVAVIVIAVVVTVASALIATIAPNVPIKRELIEVAIRSAPVDSIGPRKPRCRR